MLPRLAGPLRLRYAQCTAASCGGLFIGPTTAFAIAASHTVRCYHSGGISDGRGGGRHTPRTYGGAGREHDRPPQQRGESSRRLSAERRDAAPHRRALKAVDADEDAFWDADASEAPRKGKAAGGGDERHRDLPSSRRGGGEESSDRRGSDVSYRRPERSRVRDQGRPAFSRPPRAVAGEDRGRSDGLEERHQFRSDAPQGEGGGRGTSGGAHRHSAAEDASGGGDCLEADAGEAEYEYCDDDLLGVEFRRDTSAVLFSCPLCRASDEYSAYAAVVQHAAASSAVAPATPLREAAASAAVPVLGLDALAAHMCYCHHNAQDPRGALGASSSLATSPSSGLDEPSSLLSHSYPFTLPHQRRSQADYQRHNTMALTRLLRAHARLSSATPASTPAGGTAPLPSPHIALLIDVANMERTHADALLTLPPLGPSDACVLRAAGLIPPSSQDADDGALGPLPPEGTPLPSLDEALRRHILRVMFSAHPFFFVCMLEDSIVPNCRVMGAVAQLASLHSGSTAEILWVAAGDEAGDYASAAFLSEARRGEREVLAAALRSAGGAAASSAAAADADIANPKSPSYVAPCFRQRPVSRALAKHAATASPLVPLPLQCVLLSDDQIQRSAMGRVLGTESFGYSRTYAPPDIAQALRSAYWRHEEAVAEAGCGAPDGMAARPWSDAPWLVRYLCA